MSRVESDRCQKSKAADVKAADVAQSGRCCSKRPIFAWKRSMFVRKQPMIDIKRPMCPKAADVFAKSDQCTISMQAADVWFFKIEIPGRTQPMYPKGESGQCVPSVKVTDVWFSKIEILGRKQPMYPMGESGRCTLTLFGIGYSHKSCLDENQTSAAFDLFVWVISHVCSKIIHRPLSTPTYDSSFMSNNILLISHLWGKLTHRPLSTPSPES